MRSGDLTSVNTGNMINHRLFKHYNIDTGKDLQIPARCPKPFDTLLIDSSGSCYACECTAWLPQSIGNIQLTPLQDIIDSSTHATLQQPINDGTYSYCNSNLCPYIKLYKNTQNANWSFGPDHQHTMTHSHIKHLRLAIDNSCNLKCPSCRTSRIMLTRGSQFRARRRMADRVIDYMNDATQPLTVHVGSDGDPFASLIYRYFLRHAPSKDNIELSLMTNGLLMKQMHPRVESQFQRLGKLEISIDGATKHTYEKLRLGGNFHKLMSNLHWLNTIDHRKNFEVHLHFVVQPDNYREMIDMIKLREDVGADKLFFNPIQNWNTFGNWSQMNIMDSEHPDHEPLQKMIKQILRRPDYNRSVLLHGFDNLF